MFNEEVEKTELEFYSLKDSISSGTDDLVKRFKDISAQIQERFLDAVLAQVKSQFTYPLSWFHHTAFSRVST